MSRRLAHVDRVGVEERAAELGRRSIKMTAKQQGIRLAVSVIDLTTLEGSDTAGKVRQLRQGGLSGPEDAGGGRRRLDQQGGAAPVGHRQGDARR